MSMDLQLLKQADQVLSKCGRPTIQGGSIVPLYKAFLMPMVLQPNQSTVFTKEITGETIWGLRAISSDQTSAAVFGVRLQIQLPNGRFLIGNNGQDVGQFAWVGSYRYLMDPEVDCFPGSKIQVTLSDTVGLGAARPVNLLFEGAYKFVFRNGPLQNVVSEYDPKAASRKLGGKLLIKNANLYHPGEPQPFAEDDYYALDSVRSDARARGLWYLSWLKLNKGLILGALTGETIPRRLIPRVYRKVLIRFARRITQDVRRR